MKKYILVLLLFLLTFLVLFKMMLPEMEKQKSYDGQYRIIITNGEVIKKGKDNLIVFKQDTRKIQVKTNHKIYKRISIGDVVDLKYDLFENKLIVIKK